MSFINNEVINDSKYSEKIDEKKREKLKKLEKYISKSSIQTKMLYSQMAELFEVDESNMKDLYTYYISVNNINAKMSLQEFSLFVLNNILNNKNYCSKNL